MDIFNGARVAVAFCSPHRKIKLAGGEEIVDTITVQWHRARNALAVGTNINTLEFFADGMEVGVARHQAAERSLSTRPRPEYIFFLDDDVLPAHDAFVKLFFRLQTNPKADIAAGVYCCKGLHDPLIYQGDGMGPFWDWTVGDLLTTEQHGITGVHMGLTLIRTSLFQRMLDAGVVNDDTPFFKTVRETFRDPNGALKTRSGTEDLWFCRLAQDPKVKAQLLIDTSVLAGHIDKNTGVTYGLAEYTPPVMRAKWLSGEDKRECGTIECTACAGAGAIGSPASEEVVCGSCGGKGAIKGNLKLALDLGAGGHKRSWDGHRTYTTDLRADSKPDYVQDTRWLNLPTNHFDLVASSHHMEHIPRFDQEKAWAECFRVCKPGGKFEHIVPSGEWAAAKICDGQCDEHVMNVLYGAQESHGYARELNLHFFVYTKGIAKALAESAGFVNVTCEDWSDNPNLGYNLVVRGEKPAVAEANLPVAEEVSSAPSETAATGGAA